MTQQPRICPFWRGCRKAGEVRLQVSSNRTEMLQQCRPGLRGLSWQRQTANNPALADSILKIGDVAKRRSRKPCAFGALASVHSHQFFYPHSSYQAGRLWHVARTTLLRSCLDSPSDTSANQVAGTSALQVPRRIAYLKQPEPIKKRSSFSLLILIHS